MSFAPPRPRTALAVVLGFAACGMPVDPAGSLASATGHTLRVGAVESPPFLSRRVDGATGPEAELLQAYASHLDAVIEWNWGSLDAHMLALREHRLHLVAAGLTSASPWHDEVAFSLPWQESAESGHVLAVAPGENGMLLDLDRLIVSRREPPR